MSGRFFSTGPAPNPAYARCRDSRVWDTREKVEALWAQYAPYCPDEHEHFLNDAKSHFHERVWEMHLACMLLDHGYPLRKVGPWGPDICIDVDPPIWIEAIAVQPGSGPDRVLERHERGRERHIAPGVSYWGGVHPSDESVVLRCTSAVREKNQKRAGYVRDGVIGRDDPFVVAINLGLIEDVHEWSEDTPYVVQALYGLGEPYFRVPVNPPGPEETGRHPRPVVRKRSGAKVDAQGFRTFAYAGVSGVLSTCATLANASFKTGDDLVFLHNQMACAPLRAGLFKFGTEYLPRGNVLRPRRWSVERQQA